MTEIHKKIIIVDDKVHVRDSLQILIETQQGLTVLGSYENALSIVEIVIRDQPDLIIMDIDMPGISGIEAVKRLRKSKISAAIMMLTVFEEQDKLFEAIRAGADGYLLKSSTPDEILKAILDLLAGGASFTPIMAKKVLSHFQKPKENSYNLTPREIEVLSNLIKGKSIRKTSLILGISYETVRSHVKNIYQKIHVNSLSEAVSKALKEKIVD